MAETPAETLMRMFPNIEPSVVNMILENVNDDLGAATELLLDMSGGYQTEVVSSSEFPALQPLDSEEFPSVSAVWGSNRPQLPKPKSVPRVVSKSSTSSPSLSSIGSKMTSEPGLSDCLHDLERGSNVLVVMRGLPGSGKSTLSRR